jgi:selT/selW/selH-like putative selenoprotein
MLHQKYPEIAIEGDNFPPGGARLQLAQFFSVAKIAVIVMVLASINLFQNVGQPTPGWWAWMLENKLYACMMTFFLCNAVETQLISTGAFEISLNDMPLWSKLESGRIPQPAELFQIIENHIRMRGAGALEGNEDFSSGYIKDEL